MREGYHRKSVQAATVIRRRLAFGAVGDHEPHDLPGSGACTTEPGIVDREVGTDESDPREASRAQHILALHRAGIEVSLSRDGELFE
jgi:hypothetical protein